jgi:integral membrane sensor domain MASE1
MHKEQLKPARKEKLLKAGIMAALVMYPYTFAFFFFLFLTVKVFVLNHWPGVLFSVLATVFLAGAIKTWKRRSMQEHER